MILSFSQDFYALYLKKVPYAFWWGLPWIDIGAYPVINNVTEDEATNPTKWATEFDSLISKYISENSEKARKDALHLVELMKEYSDLLKQSKN